MTLLMYAITDEPRGVAGSSGVDGQPLGAVTHAGLTAVVGEHPGGLGRSEPELLAYERALERLMAEATILPVRFGTALESRAEVERLLTDRHDDFELSLGRVRGAVELTLHARVSVGTLDLAAAQRSGTAYLQRLAAVRRRANAIAIDVRTAFADVARAARFVVRCDSEDAVAASFLVEEGNIDAFLDQLRELEARCEHASFVCTGPWPPYSFAEPEEA